MGLLAVAAPFSVAGMTAGASTVGAPGENQQTTTVRLAGTTTPFAGATTASVPSGVAAGQVRARQATHRSLSPRNASNASAAGISIPVVQPTSVAPGTPGLQRSWQGADAYDVEQTNFPFTFTPPDQGLCVGSGSVLEAVNDTVRTFTTAGVQTSPAISLNRFFGYPTFFNTTTNRFGPELTDPSCLFDATTQRFFVTVLTLDLDPATGGLLLTDHVDIAVSRTSNPNGSYNIYKIPVTDAHAGPLHAGCPCVGDFPHFGLDRYGMEITTNEYPFSSAPGRYGNNFNGAQLYALSKTKLAAGANSVAVVHFSDTSLANGRHARVPGFTVWPAVVPDGAYVTANNGSEYFVSSTAAEEANPHGFTGFSNTLGVYRLSNTASLATSSPSLTLARALVSSEAYGVPPLSSQKPGPTPLLDCLAVDCLPNRGPSHEVEGGLDSSDSRPLTVWYADGRLFTALDTVMQVRGNLQAGPAWFAINPSASPASASIAGQGYLGLAANNIIYPSIATTTAGVGIMDFAISGQSYYPSQGYMTWGPNGPTGAPWIAAAGAAPLDDFCQYNFFNCAQTPTPLARPRYGDYSMAALSNGTVYIADEYVAVRCTFATYKNDPTCGGTRSPISNWSTRISAVTP